MRLLNQAALEQCLSHLDCVQALEPAMRAVSAGRTDLPLRQYLNIPDTGGKFTLMPGYLDEPRCFGVKIVSKYPREPGSAYGSHVGAVMLFDAELGIPVALLDGSELTAIRTAAASALATRELSRPDSEVLTVLGTGMEARHHLQAIAGVRDITQIRIWGRTPANAQALANTISQTHDARVVVCSDVAQAVAGADIICTTTSSKEPILFGDELSPGQHLNLVGAAIIEAAEVDAQVVRRSRFFTDYRPSALAQAGELAAAMAQGLSADEAIAGEIGQVLAGQVPGRQNAEQITVYKSLGVAAQDLAAATAALAHAQAKGIGQVADWN